MKNFIILILFGLVFTAADSIAEKNTSESSGFNLQKGQENLPTYIKSDSVTLKSEEKTFQYTGNVEVKQGDLTLTADVLDGKYNEDNKIQQLIASKNVVIIKGETIRAHGEKAIYEAATETVVLTENPELQQNGSVLTADLIRIFLDENRSTAEGAVRVKLVNENKEDEGKKNDNDIKSLIRK